MMRSCTPSDLPWVMETADKAWRGINAAYQRACGEELFNLRYPDALARKGREMRAICAEQPARVFVCEEEGRRVGFIHAPSP